MKRQRYFVIGLVLASISPSLAVAITLGQTAGGARFFISDGSPALANVTLSMGWMSDPSDGNSFIAFASTAMHGNTVFSTGVGTLAGNSSAAELIQAAGKNVYIRVISGDKTQGGIWMSSTLYPADLAAASVTPGSASLTADIWTVMQPSLNWNYGQAGYIADTAALGLSDVSATPTQRTGDGFYLFVPEPSTGFLAISALGVLFRRKRKCGEV